jgi:hypothetical protein
MVHWNERAVELLQARQRSGGGGGGEEPPCVDVFSPAPAARVAAVAPAGDEGREVGGEGVPPLPPPEAPAARPPAPVEAVVSERAAKARWDNERGDAEYTI